MLSVCFNNVACAVGPCPPCPKTILTKCHCGKGASVPVRCGVNGWTCGKVCRKVLSCGLHLCEQACHPGKLMLP